ncbi:MAG TPA: hypothetical protein VF525_00725 [Pyrinomonadaceae bacterium]|jgi:hypothetical protein
MLVTAVPYHRGGQALAFKPDATQRADPNDITHVDITEKAIKDLLTKENIIPGVTEVNNSMEKAINEIKEANAKTDLGPELANQAAHFDNEAFAEGQARLNDRFQHLVSDLEANQASEARKKLGQALHAIQDFYSHSNWVEMGWQMTNPYLGKFDQTANLLASAAGKLEPTCADCPVGVCPCVGNISTPKLTSGYFQFLPTIPYLPPPSDAKHPGKCSHGGPGDRSVDTPGTLGINKDSLNCNVSPHNYLHQRATQLAGDHTKEFLRDIKAKVTLKQFKALLGAGTSLAFAIDTTGSMGQEIAGVRQQAIDIVGSRLDTELEPLEYVLVEVNDPFTAVQADTPDATVFVNAISRLRASGGGDCPELPQSGLLKALQAMDYGGELILFTDASARDDELAPNVRALADEKGIKISTAASGSCSPIDPEYYRTATDTGGQVFVISRSEADNLTPLVDFLVRPNAVDVLAVSDALVGTAKTYSVPVDSTMKRVTFSISGTANVVVRRPDGSVVQPTDVGVRAVILGQGRIFSVTAPPPGTWEVTVNGSGNLSVRVSGESPLNLSAFNFVEPAGWPGHEGHASIAGLPLAASATKIDAQLVGGPGLTAQFELRAADGTLVRPLALTELPRPLAGLSREFFGSIETPAAPFLVYVRGVDASGKPYQRLRPGVIKPQTVKLITPALPGLSIAQSSTYTFQVQNLGPAATFALSVTDDHGFVVNFSPGNIALAQNQTGDVTVRLLAPAGVNDGTTFNLTLSARNPSNPDAGNFALVPGHVSANRPPDVSQARPSVAALWPPNHDLIAVSIQGVTDADGDPVTIRVTRVMQDEATNDKGDGDKCPDASGVGTASAQLRAERSGKGNGRFYTIFFEATDGRGGSTPGSVRVSVPHEQDGQAIEDGASFDATSCP